MQRMTPEQFNQTGERLFGPDKSQWRFECPKCKTNAPVAHWSERGIAPELVAAVCPVCGHDVRTEEGQATAEAFIDEGDGELLPIFAFHNPVQFVG